MSSDKKEPDIELKNAFKELQLKMINSQQKMRLADMQIESLKCSLTHSSLTEKEIKALPESVRVYKSVGRMFMLSAKDEVVRGLSEKQGSCQEKIKALESNKEYLSRNLKESEDSLREMVQQKRAQ